MTPGRRRRGRVADDRTRAEKIAARRRMVNPVTHPGETIHLLNLTDLAGLTPDADLVVGALHDAGVAADSFREARTTLRPSEMGRPVRDNVLKWRLLFPVLERHLGVLTDIEHLHATLELTRSRHEWRRLDLVLHGGGAAEPSGN